MFKGSNVALITPFKDNGLDEEAYIKLIHFHMDNGTSGLVPAGTTGESPTLNHEEHQRVIDLSLAFFADLSDEDHLFFCISDIAFFAILKSFLL